MLRAETALAEAAALCRLAREPEWEAWTLTNLGYRVAFARGDLELAVEHMNAALALLPEPDGERAGVATFLAEALAYVGRLDDAESALREAAEIGRRLGDHRVRAYAAWTWTTLASLRGRRGRRRSSASAPSSAIPGDWFEHPTGAEFLADAARGAGARGGARPRASSTRSARVARAEALGYPEIAWIATGAVEARFGDPALALARRWRRSRPRRSRRRATSGGRCCCAALAASRAGDARAGALAAQAHAAAEALGHPDLPARHEPDVAAALGAAAGPPALHVTLLGGFGVTADGRALVPPPGRGATLVKLLALRGGPADAAKRRSRCCGPRPTARPAGGGCATCSNRVRASCGELVARDGESLVLAPDADVDARRFEEAAAAVRAAPDGRAGRASPARRWPATPAICCPTDRYEAWASAARERLRRRYLDLLDLLADDAVERGDLDEAIRLLDQAQIAEPLDESRYVRAAELLLFQGRRGSAAVLVERALRLRAGLGLPETPTAGAAPRGRPGRDWTSIGRARAKVRACWSP